MLSIHQLTLEQEEGLFAKLEVKKRTSGEEVEYRFLFMRDFYRNPAHLYEFCEQIMGYDFETKNAAGLMVQMFNRRLHGKLCEIIVQSERQDVALIIARDHFKSTLAQAYAIQWLLGNADEGILLATSNDDKASKMADPIIETFLENKKFRGLFPDYCPSDGMVRKTWCTKHEFTIPKRRRKHHTPSFMAKGIMTSLSGFHFGLIICDDPVDEKDTTEVTIKAAVKKFKLLRPMIIPGKHLLYIGTIYKDGDLLSQILNGELGKNWIKVVMPATEDGTISGEPIFPERFTKEILAERLSDMLLYDFSTQYLLNPIPEGESRIQEPWFRKHPPFTAKMVEDGLEINGTLVDLDIYMAVDPAWSVTKTSDKTGIIIGGFDGRDWWLLKKFSGKVRMEQLMPKVAAMAEHWGVRVVGWEAQGLQGKFYEMVQKYMADNLCTFRLKKLFPNKRGISWKCKEDRILYSVVPALSQGRIHLAQGEFEELVEQCIRIPYGRYDDLADAFAYLIWFERALRRRGEEVKLSDLAEWKKNKKRTIRMVGGNRGAVACF